LDDVVVRLRRLKVWAGNPSYGAVTDRINAAWLAIGRPASDLARKSTVADCFRPGRRRINVDLVIAIVQALHGGAGYLEQWRQVLRVALAEPPASAQVRVQHTLPEPVPGFAARDSELATLRRLLRPNAEGGAAVVAAIEGMAGVGKTQLAIRLGRLLADAEPFDHVLFVNLRGFHPDPSQPPADPSAVLDGFLRLLGVPAAQIPHDLGARTALYRKRLAAARALVVLDNATNEEQVEPLLPDGAGCRTMITSRRSLAGLRSAATLPVGVFTPEEARGYLRASAPEVPVGDDPDALDRVGRRCGYLPLALGLIGGHLRAKPHWTVTDHAEWLEERHRNQRLDTGIELALSTSYQDLPVDRRQLFRLLALHPGHDLDTHAVAALAGVSVRAAEEHLRALGADHLLQQPTPGRFTLHDLVRAYAADRAADEDRLVARKAALTGLFDYYLAATATAMDTLFEAEQHRRPARSPTAAALPPVAEPGAARAWLDADRANLIAAASHAGSRGWPEVTTRLAATMFRYLDVGGHFSDAVVLHTHAREAARTAGDRHAEAGALSNLAGGYWRLGRLHLAADRIQQAQALFRELADKQGESRAVLNLGRVHYWLGHYEQAADHYQQAIIMLRELDHRTGEADALDNLGLVYARLGRYPQALDHHRQGLALYRELGHRTGEADVLDNFGLTYAQFGRYPLALDHHEQALTLYRELGYRVGEADALNNLGLVEARLGRCRQATAHHQEALVLYRELDQVAGEASALNSLGLLHTRSGRYAEALDHHEQALARFRELNYPAGEASALSGLGLLHAQAGRYPSALDQHERAAALYRELGDRVGEIESLNGLGEAQLAAGRPDKAHAEHTLARTLATEVDARHELARAHRGLAYSHTAAGNPDQARRHADAALALYAELGLPEPDEPRDASAAAGAPGSESRARSLAGLRARLSVELEF
jgi:tetratricopeptide (TPR) repeat protein